MAQKPLIEALEEAEEAAANRADYDDDLMPEAIALVKKLQKASTSLLAAPLPHRLHAGSPSH
jgi:hypothetical protein